MKNLYKTILGGLMFLLVSCGPSAEEIATMTASAWTPTPFPTPIPIDLTVTVTDESGTPIEGASIVMPESGSDEPVLSNAQGKFSWTNLAREAATLKISAQGYLSAEQGATLQRGSNDVNVTLKRDPFGILPSEACAAGETLQYMEDFQDGEAQDWHGDENDNKNKVARYIGPAIDDASNQVFTFDANKLTPGPDAWLGANYGAGDQGYFGDAVWRLRFMVSRPTGPIFSWHQNGPIEFGGQELTEARYAFLFWGAPQNQVRLQRTLFGSAGPLADDTAAQGTFTQVPQQWHRLEISSFQGHLQVWVDGKQELDYPDPEPLPAGRMGIWLGPFTEASITVLYFDNITVCGLNAPFTSTVVPAAP